MSFAGDTFHWQRGVSAADAQLARSEQCLRCGVGMRGHRRPTDAERAEWRTGAEPVDVRHSPPARLQVRLLRSRVSRLVFARMYSAVYRFVVNKY